MGRGPACRGVKKRASFKCGAKSAASARRGRTVVYKKSTSMVLVGIQLLMFLVLLNYYVDLAEAGGDGTSADALHSREPRKMFGGYRITPRFCTPTRSFSRQRSNEGRRGPAICMFNHECLQRSGEVVGACMDGFLFGACCQLRGEAAIVRDSVESGVVMMVNSSEGQSLRPGMKIPDSNIYIIKPTERPSYQHSTPEQPSSKEDVIELGTHYIKHPSTLSVSINHLVSSTEKFDDLTSNGVAQITNTLLLGDHPPDGSIVTMVSSSNPSGLFSHSTISHEEADTILLNENGSVANDVFRPADFSGVNIHVSTSQTKPSMVHMRPQSTTPSPGDVPYRPIHQRPQFKPKPTKASSNSQDKFVLVPTVAKPVKDDESENHSEMASIESIMNMLNESHPSTIAPDDILTSSKTERPDIKATTVESYQSTPSTPLIQSTSHSTNKPTSGHYITSTVNKYTTFQPPSTSYVYSPVITRRPGYTGPTNKYPDKYGSTSIFYTKKPTGTKTSSKPNIDVSINDRISSTTLSYDEYWGPNTNTHSTTPSSYKPPSTSYVYSPLPTKRPASNVHNVVGPSYDSSGSLDTFSSVTPTVIVLSSLDSQHEESFTPNPVKFPVKEPVEAEQNGQDEFVEVPLKPHKKPIHQVTINNIITSNNLIHLGQNQKVPSSSERPAPTVLITPKPNTVTSSSVTYVSRPQKPAVVVNDPNRPTKKPSGNRRTTTVKTSSAEPTQSPYIPTTIRNEFLTSPDDLINFPPVRNPNLNATGSNPSAFNNSITMGIDDDIVLQEVEFTTPAFSQEDDDLKDKMSLFVNKIVGSLQGTFQELHDIVILDKTPNTTITQQNNKKPANSNVASDNEIKPTKKPNTPTKRPNSSTSKKPTKAPASSANPTTTTKKPVRTATTQATTTTTKKVTKATVSTKKPRPSKPKVTTTPATTTITESSIGEEDFTTEVDGNYKHLCGVRPLVKSGRIVGGKGATFGEWPWQVLVRESTWLGLFTKNKCGGVLITNKYVTTAAHCQPGFLASLVAVFGEFDISGELESKRSVSKNVRRVIVHRQYDAATFENDLAVLELESPIHYDTHIVPICMPSDDADFTGRMATVTGWGRLKYGGGVPSVLQEVRVPIMENQVCQEMFQAAGHTKVILESFLCAGYANGQKDSCEGDSGGPLVLQRSDGRWELAGTVSHGIKCAAPYLPGVYMRTTFYKPWLRGITGAH